MLAANPILSLISVDICLHSYTLPCARLLKSIHSNRFQFIQGRSEDVLNSLDPARMDFVHIDGGHDPSAARFDLQWFTSKAPKGCLLLVDDCYVGHIREVLGGQVRVGLIRPAHNGLPSSGENQLFIRC